MAGRRMLTDQDREEISRGIAAGEGQKQIAARIGRDASVVCREIARHGGWGVKGSAKSKKGLLYSAGGSSAIVLKLNDGRRYLVGCDADDGDVRRVLEALDAQACDGNGPA